MKKAIFALLITTSILLQACSLGKPNNTEKSDFDLSNLQLSVTEDYVNTAINKVSDISEYKTNKEVDDYVTAPCVYINDKNTYLIRNFPKDLKSGSEAMEKFLKDKNLAKEIEIYKNFDYDTPIETISLTDLENRTVVFYSISYNNDDTFSIVGLENTGKEQSVCLYIIDKKGNIVFETALNADIDNICAVGYQVFTLQKSKNDYDLVKIDAKTQNVSTVDSSIVAFFENDGEIYYINNALTEKFDYETTLNKYNIEKAKTSLISTVDTDQQIISSSYDKKNNILYFSNSKNLYSYDIKSAKTSKIMSASNSSINIHQISEGYLSVGIGNNQISIYELGDSDVSIDNQKIILNICEIGNDEVLIQNKYNYILSFMEARGLSFDLNVTYYSNNTNEYSNTMAKKLLSGDDDFDIFYVDTTMGEMFKKQYYEDLGAYDILKEYYNNMIPGAEDLCTIDGLVCLFPTKVSFDVIKYRKNIVNDNIDIELPKAFSNMIEFKDNIVENFKDPSSLFMNNNFSHSLFLPWFEQFTSNFMAKEIDNNTAENDLKMLFETSIALINDESVIIGTSDASNDVFLSLGQNMGTMTASSDDISLAPMIKVSDKYKEQADCDFLAVNPNSKNKDAAVAFLAYYLESNKEYKGATAELLKDFDTSNISNSGYDTYVDQISNCIRAHNISDLPLYLADKYSSLLSEKITIDDAAEDTLKYLTMLRDE